MIQMVKNLPTMWETWGLIPGSGRSPEEGNGYPLQYSCMENSMDRGAWWVTIQEATKSQTRLNEWHFHLKGRNPSSGFTQGGQGKQRKHNLFQRPGLPLCSPSAIWVLKSYTVGGTRALPWMCLVHLMNTQKPGVPVTPWARALV